MYIYFYIYAIAWEKKVCSSNDMHELVWYVHEMKYARVYLSILRSILCFFLLNKLILPVHAACTVLWCKNILYIFFVFIENFYFLHRTCFCLVLLLLFFYVQCGFIFIIFLAVSHVFMNNIHES